MKYTLLLIFSFITQLSQANPICAWFFEPERQFNLTERSEALESTELDVLLADTSKTWIQTRHKEYRAYKFIPGRKNKPLVVFMMGLGGSIEESLHKNLVLKDYIKLKYPVLILEGSKLGDTAIINERTKFHGDFKSNMEGYEDLFSVFLKEQNLAFSSMIISGHSYGAYGASHLATKINDLIEAVRPEAEPVEFTLKLFAPAVTNFNNRLNPNWVNTVLEKVSNYLDFWGTNAGYRLQVKEVTKALVASIPSLVQDPVKLKMSAELTVDAGSEYLIKILKKLDPSVDVQIYLGSNENVLFPMMHYELYQELVAQSQKVHIIQIQGSDHFVTDKLTPKQSRSVTKFTLPQNADPRIYFIISSQGYVISAELDELKYQLQTSSLQLWNEFIANQDVRYVYFGAIPIRDLNSYYPSEWQP